MNVNVNEGTFCRRIGQEESPQVINKPSAEKTLDTLKLAHLS